jgi:hypothetical protein
MMRVAVIGATVFGLMVMSGTAEEAEGPDFIEVARAVNPNPNTLPTIRVVKEKLWGRYFPMISVRFPNVPGFQCDSWSYESSVDFEGARALDGGRVELIHRDQNNPQALVLTTVTPEPGAVTVEARMELDTVNHADAALPDAPSGLNLCWQLRHAEGFASAPDTYPSFVERCFIFTEKGRTFLLDTERNNIPVQAPEHEYNNPPWVQMYVGVWQDVPKAGEKSWADYSSDRYVTRVMGAVSRDGEYLTAIANDSAGSMSQAWHDCMHNNPQWLPRDAPVGERRWRLKIYAMANDPDALLKRVETDFPGADAP